MTSALAPRTIDAGGVRWSVATTGAGPVLLALHGTGASLDSFEGLAPLLAERFTFVAPDLPGHARSSTPDGRGMTVDGMARSIAALLAALGARPAVVVGHSAGAAILARMTLDGALAPRAFVGLNPALKPLAGALRVMSPIAKLMALAPGVPTLVSTFARDDRAVQRLVDGTGSTLDARATARYAALVRDRRHVAGAIAMMAGWDLDRLDAELPKLAPPPLFIVGDDDRTVPPSQAVDVARRIAGARVERLPRLGHLAHEEAPATVAALIVGHAVERGVLSATRPDERPTSGR